MTNEAYVNHNFHGIVVIGLIAMVIFAAKGFATYGSAVMLSSIGNSIIANNQRRLFDKLLQREYRLLRRPPFVRIHRPAHHRRQRRQPGDQSPHHRHRPRSDVADRAVDRDGDPGSGHVARRLHRGAAGVLFPAQADPAGARHRAHAVHRRHAHHRDHAGSPAGHAHGQGVLARGRDAATARRSASPRSSTNPTRWRGSPTAPAR